MTGTTCAPPLKEDHGDWTCLLMYALQDCL